MHLINIEITDIEDLKIVSEKQYCTKVNSKAYFVIDEN